MGLIVRYTSEEAEALNLSKELILDFVETRLRAAGLYELNPSSFLGVDVKVYKTAFNIHVFFFKYLKDLRTETEFYAATWDTGALGTHDNNAGYVLNTISQYLDEFLVQYHRVNQEACAAR